MSYLAQVILSYVLKFLWSKASEEIKSYLAHDQIVKNVKESLAKYEQVISNYDELNRAGKLTDQTKEIIRQEKIKIEEDLINRIQS